jgi:ketosteroid isomerase-like protein
MIKCMGIDVAKQAYEHFCTGLAKGEWAEFVALLGDDVDLIWPYPPNVGHYQDAEGRAKLVEFAGQLGGPGNRITDVDVVSVTKGADRATFEDRSSGVVGGYPYEARRCITFVVRDDRIVGFHEYTAPV